MAQFNFDANSISPQDKFSALPNGEYAVMITESEIKDTRDGTGQYLQLVLEVIEGHYKGRRVWERLNIVNPNKTAAEIAQRKLSQICHAVGELSLQDTAQLHQKPMLAKIVYRAPKDGYDESNDVKSYEQYGSQPAPVQAPQPQAAPAQAAPPAPNKPAWA